MEQLLTPYVTRTQEQFVAEIKAFLPTIGITDLSDTESTVAIAKMFGAVLENLSLDLDYKAKQTFLASVTQHANAIRIARQFGYAVGGARRARLRVKITVEPEQPFRVQGLQKIVSPDGIEYRFIEDPTTLTNPEKFVWAEEFTGETGTLQFTATGTPGTLISLVALPDVAESQSISLTVDGQPWERHPNLILSGPTDLHYHLEVQPEGYIGIRFGDGVNGAVLPLGADVVVSYETTRGSLGNVPAGTTFVPGDGFDQGTGSGSFSPGTVFRIEAATPGIGGREAESLDEIRVNVPKFSVTNDRIITPQDLHDQLSISPFRVAKSYPEYQCGGVWKAYVMGYGGQTFSDSERADIQAYIRPRMPLGVPPMVLNAGLLHLRMVWRLHVRGRFKRYVVKQAMMDRLLDYMGLGTSTTAGQHEIKGEIKVGNLYEVTEGTPGAEWTELVTMYALPYALPISHVTPLQFVYTPNELYRGTPSKYRVNALNTTTWQLYQMNPKPKFKGEFTVGQVVSLPEGTIQVTGGLAAGRKWEFFLYPVATSLQLQEASIPFSDNSDIQIIATGGY